MCQVLLRLGVPGWGGTQGGGSPFSVEEVMGEVLVRVVLRGKEGGGLGCKVNKKC